MPEGKQAILDVFPQACSGLSDFDAVRAKALRSGWQDYRPPPESGVGKLLALGRAATSDGNVSLRALRLDHGKEQLVVLLVRAETGGVWVNGCRLYGSSAPTAPSEDEISRRLGRKPAEASNADGIITATWTPGWARGDDSLELMVIPPETQPVRDLGFAGWALVAQSLGDLP